MIISKRFILVILLTLSQYLIDCVFLPYITSSFNGKVKRFIRSIRKSFTSSSNDANKDSALSSQSPYIESDESISHNKAKNTIIDGNKLLITIPPILFMIFGTSSAKMSPFDPQAISVRGPFFQGWLFRTVGTCVYASFTY